MAGIAASIWSSIRSYLDWFYFPKISWTDVLDIIIIAYLIYHILLWLKTSRAWTLLRGIGIIVLFLGLAALLRLNTILWISKNLINVFLLAIIILFQPELRNALDELGRKNILRNIINNTTTKDPDRNLSDRTVFELVKTVTELSKTKTGALIVLEHETPLGEYINTGILIDAEVTEQLLVNIFEKNTPLHDGAVIVRNNRIIAATCYLPLTERTDVNKELGTRHRAGLGISEATDSMTIIVSEETGGISIAHRGVLYRDLGEAQIREKLADIQDKPDDKPVRAKRAKKGGHKA
ncbi:MAG: diadenylate cyclase CdaA [Eubacterium sp.]|nr:diadenylate cyclase CdaA [Eubacterium sp.]